MGPEAVSIRPVWGGPLVRKNARLSFHQGVLQVTDPRGRTHTFNLSDGDGPYQYRYGDWKGEADYALVDRSGRAVLLVDQKVFRLSEINALSEALGLDGDEAGEQPRTRPGTPALVNLPYLKWGIGVSAVGSIAYGLWSITHFDFFVLGVTLPALLCLIPLVVFAKKAVPRDDELRAEYAQFKPELDETLALAEDYLAEHRMQVRSKSVDDDMAQAVEAPPKEHPESETPLDGR